MKINKNNILFLIRTYNEWDHLLNTIDVLKKAWFNKILIVDDGSKDGTDEKLENRNDIFYLRHSINRWAWAALETWFTFVRRYYQKYNFSYVITFDPDGQHDINDVNNFINEFEKDKDLQVIIWSRFIGWSSENMPFHRKIILFLAKIFTLFISQIIVSDPHNGYRMLTVSAIKKIHLTLDGFEYSSELIDKIASEKLKFKEVPVNIKYTEYSLSKWQSSWNAINIALKMIWTKFFK